MGNQLFKGGTYLKLLDEQREYYGKVRLGNLSYD